MNVENLDLSIREHPFHILQTYGIAQSPQRAYYSGGRHEGKTYEPRMRVSVSNSLTFPLPHLTHYPNFPTDSVFFWSS